jgi:hypothetical protein
VELPIDHVRYQLVERGLDVPDISVASAVAAVNTGKHVAVVADEVSQDVVVAFAELLADCAASLRLCIGWFNLHATAGALVRLRDVVQIRFMADIWLVLTNPSPAAIFRTVAEVRDQWHGVDARLLVATSAESLTQANLSPAARRALIPILV